MKNVTKLIGKKRSKTFIALKKLDSFQGIHCKSRCVFKDIRAYVKNFLNTNWISVTASEAGSSESSQSSDSGSGEGTVIFFIFGRGGGVNFFRRIPNPHPSRAVGGGVLLFLYFSGMDTSTECSLKPSSRLTVWNF